MRKPTIAYLVIIFTLLGACIGLLSSKGVVLTFEPSISMDSATAIAIWAAVLTILFLVFSVLGLVNIDRKISELNKTKDEIAKTSLEMKELLSKLRTSTDEEKNKIVNQAQKELKKIINESAIRQNLFDSLGRIAALPDPDRKVQEYTDLLKTYPHMDGVNYAFIHVCRGDAYMALGKKDKALVEYEEAQRINPKEGISYLALGYFYVGQKDYAKSIEYFSKALEIQPESVANLMNIGNSYAAMGNNEEARKYFERALSINPEIAEVYYNKSIEYNGKKDPMSQEITLHYLDRCLELNPFFFKARINKAATFKDQGKYEQAIDEYTKVVTEGVVQDVVMSLVERGYDYRQIGLSSLALLSHQQAFFLDPHNLQNLVNLAICYFNLAFPHLAYEFTLQAYYEATIQNNHEFDNDLNNLLKGLYETFGRKSTIISPDTIEDYIKDRIRKKKEGYKETKES